MRFLFEALRHSPENCTTDTSSAFSVDASSLTKSIALCCIENLKVWISILSISKGIPLLQSSRLAWVAEVHLRPGREQRKEKNLLISGCLVPAKIARLVGPCSSDRSKCVVLLPGMDDTEKRRCSSRDSRHSHQTHIPFRNL